MKRFATSAVALLALAVPAAADDWARAFFDHSSTYRNPAEHRHYRPYSPPRVVNRQPEVRSWVQRHNQDNDVQPARHCYDAVTVVGDPGHSTERARNNAIAAYSAHIVWKYGQQAMSIDYAQRIKFSCSQSSIPKPGGTARAVDAGAEKLLGKTTDELRCELTAVPCRAPVGEQVK